MRRALAVLIVGALGFGIGTPAAAGNDPSTKRPEPARLKLACSPVPSPAADVAAPEADPAVQCEWSQADAAAGYRLWRGSWAGRRVVYRGTETQATDQKVRAGGHYVYRVHAYDASGRVIAKSDGVHVSLPGGRLQRLDLACAVNDVTIAIWPAPNPTVTCKWSELAVPSAAATGGAPGRQAEDTRPVKLVPRYRLWRGGDGHRVVVYRGDDTTATDAKVRSCRTYRYKVHGVDRRGRIVAASAVVNVDVPCRVRPVPVPAPLPESEPDPKPLPLPEPDPVPAPDPKPLPRPEPEPKPLPLPERKPAPEPEPKPVPDPEPKPLPAIDLACRASSGTVEPTDDRMMRPTLWEGPSVTCKWSLRSDDTTSTRKVAGFRLWKASRNADKHIVFRSDSETVYVDHDVVPGSAYGYLVQAVDAAGNAIASSVMVKVAV